MKFFSLRRVAASALSLTLALSSVTASCGAVASGGNCAANVDSNANVVVQESGSRCYIAFKGTQTYQWTPPSTVSTIELLVVAGGGGGGKNHASGGGAGGLIQSSSFAITSAAISVTVGAGGAGATSIDSYGGDGSNSTVSGSGIATQSAIGGGAGNSNSATSNQNGKNGGSGGGSWSGFTPGTGVAGQGSAGSAGGYNNTSQFWIGGAGGGAGSPATAANTTTATAGIGGEGLAISWIPSTLGLGQVSGSSVYFAGGGGGGATINGIAGAGGLGGGASGSYGAAAVTAATPNTGGGGGGGGLNGTAPNGGAGASGIVVVSYAVADALNTVTFKANNGSAVADTAQIINTEIATALAANPFTKTGYDFNGWNTLAGGGGTTYSAGQSVTINSGLTLFAQWTAGTNTVTFKANDGGSTTDTTQSITTDAATNLRTNSFSRTGYSFNGWNTLAGGGGTTYSAGQSVTINSGLTLFAQWTPTSQTIVYNSNGADSGDPSRLLDNYTTGSSGITLPTVGTMNRLGYQFAGWAATANGSVISGTYTTLTDSTLFAKWNPTTQTISYDPNGATGSAARTSDTYTSGGLAVTLPGVGTMAKPGHRLLGWSTSANGTVISGTYTTLTNVTLFAIWAPAVFVVTFDSNRATSGSPTFASTNFTSGDTTVILAEQGTLLRTGYSFEGWSSVANDSNTKILRTINYLVAADTTLYALWVPTTQSITYDPNGASGALERLADSYTTDSTAISLPGAGTLSKPGFTFVGWTTVAESTAHKITNPTSYAPLEAVTLYALWAAQSNSGSTTTGSSGSGNQSGNGDSSSINDVAESEGEPSTTPEEESSSTGEETPKAQEKAQEGSALDGDSGEPYSYLVWAGGIGSVLIAGLLVALRRSSRRKH